MWRGVLLCVVASIGPIVYPSASGIASILFCWTTWGFVYVKRADTAMEQWRIDARQAAHAHEARESMRDMICALALLEREIVCYKRREPTVGPN